MMSHRRRHDYSGLEEDADVFRNDCGVLSDSGGTGLDEFTQPIIRVLFPTWIVYAESTKLTRVRCAPTRVDCARAGATVKLIVLRLFFD